MLLRTSATALMAQFKPWLRFSVKKFPWVQVPAGEIGDVGPKHCPLALSPVGLQRVILAVGPRGKS
jgi:hypothetical protein